ncbi:hypothetical protein JY651_24250 [Pyxidicoccus parkwayensis]|uniref:Uncharacterized protein n=1 Tax=Pyxidicoccus parkwayensis TaxID=2813578 RepID=A0ABX7PBH1_9BACT|nr:hypothetical protein [Pyxidicoccus parkwaysis]QSQ27821.1 hypothetical protein JY651_24250 [Pyxidicoccus parkwaysis]
MANNYDFDDDDKDMKASGGGKFKEFDCPDCHANNPVHEPFGDQDEVRCNYCGTEFRVMLSAEGRVKFKEI